MSIGSKLKPVEALEDWLRSAAVETGPVFRSIRKGGSVNPDRLSEGSVADIVKHYAKAAGLDPETFSGHSAARRLRHLRPRGGRRPAEGDGRHPPPRGEDPQGLRPPREGLQEPCWQGIPLMNFGEAMKAGKRVARQGWNGKGMWICLGKGQKIGPAQFWNEHTKQFAYERYMAATSGDTDLTDDERLTEVLPYIIMKTADDKILMGWLASQSDMLAEDWVELA